MSSFQREPAQRASSSSPRNTPKAVRPSPTPDGKVTGNFAKADNDASPGNERGETVTTEEEDDDDHDGDEGGGGGAMALPMAASVILTSLPKDASTALANAGDIGVEKVTIRLKPVGSAPILRQLVFKVVAKHPFSAVTSHLRRRLGSEIKPGEGVFCYVNSVFAPSPDEIVGSLWRCFKTGDELVVAYAKTPAFG